MSVLRELRKLVLGETWALPLGVAGLLAAALVLRAVAPQVGGPKVVAAAPEIMLALGLSLPEGPEYEE